ncbi:MAG: siderophore-interacting protein [Nakamurella sp.]
MTTPYILHVSTVSRITNLGNNFRRFTFTGPTVHLLDSQGWDQRIKLIFPLPEVGVEPLPRTDDWYLQWRELPAERRNPMRTYTVRAVRPESAEVDIDIALHGRTGPASRWAMDAVAGDTIIIYGPNAEHGGPYGGVDFLPPAHTDAYLLAGDPTALPAVAAILETLPRTARGIAVLEVDHPADAQAVGSAPPGMRVQVLVRTGAGYGSQLIPAVQRAAAELCADGGSATDLEDVDIDNGLLWEAPRDEFDRPAMDSTGLYAWLAGEAGVIKAIRRHLVGELGMDRKSVAFMGYWRQGREEDNS